MEEFVIQKHPDEEQSKDLRTLVLSLTGPLDHTTAPEVRNHLRELISTEQPCPHLILDLSGCTGIDIQGLLAVSVPRQAARGRGGDLHLSDLPHVLRRHLQQLGFLQLIAQDVPNIDP